MSDKSDNLIIEGGVLVSGKAYGRFNGFTITKTGVIYPTRKKKGYKGSKQK